jgi:cysteine synthase B
MMSGNTVGILGNQLDEKNQLLNLIGNTPLLRLAKLADESVKNAEIYAKAEHWNPCGSIKDRAAWAMIRAGIEQGALTRDQTILDATSGNTGIAYAMIEAILGYKAALCIPQNTSHERKQIMRAYGAELIETDPLLSSDGAQQKAIELAAADPVKYFYPDQYNNPANWQVHYRTTAEEIWQQTNGRVTHLVAGVGTSGTFTGTVRRLKELKPGLRAVLMQPDSPLHGLEGLRHLSTTLVPGIFDRALADEQLEIETEAAQAMTRRLATHEGLLVGVSSGANVAAAVRVAQSAPPGSVIVTFLCDGGGRYLFEPFWSAA